MERMLEEVVYKFISYCIKWNMWIDTVVVAGGYKYTDCKPGTEGAGFRDLDKVLVEKANEDDVWDEGQKEDCYNRAQVIQIRSDGPLYWLILYGVYEIYEYTETDVSNLSYEEKEKLFWEDENFREEWEWFMDDVEFYPDEIDGVRDLEFDSADEFEEFKDYVIFDRYVSEIASMCGSFCSECNNVSSQVEEEFYKLFLGYKIEIEPYSRTINGFMDKEKMRSFDNE